jgi:hypothetical protein
LFIISSQPSPQSSPKKWGGELSSSESSHGRLEREERLYPFMPQDLGPCHSFVRIYVPEAITGKEKQKDASSYASLKTSPFKMAASRAGWVPPSASGEGRQSCLQSDTLHRVPGQPSPNRDNHNNLHLFLSAKQALCKDSNCFEAVWCTAKKENHGASSLIFDPVSYLNGRR